MGYFRMTGGPLQIIMIIKQRIGHEKKEIKSNKIKIDEKKTAIDRAIAAKIIVCMQI